jgi:hypothetical protein
MEQRAERRCREDKSHQSNSLDFHLKSPPVSPRASNTAKILKSRLWSCLHFSGRVSGPLGKALGFRIERVRRRVHLISARRRWSCQLPDQTINGFKTIRAVRHAR